LLILYYIAQISIYLTLDRPYITFHAVKFLVGVLQRTSTLAHTLKDNFLLYWPLALYMAVLIIGTFMSALEKLVVIIGTENKENQI